MPGRIRFRRTARRIGTHDAVRCARGIRVTDQCQRRTVTVTGGEGRCLRHSTGGTVQIGSHSQAETPSVRHTVSPTGHSPSQTGKVESASQSTGGIGSHSQALKHRRRHTAHADQVLQKLAVTGREVGSNPRTVAADRAETGLAAIGDTLVTSRMRHGPSQVREVERILAGLRCLALDSPGAHVVHAILADAGTGLPSHAGEGGPNSPSAGRTRSPVRFRGISSHRSGPSDSHRHRSGKVESTQGSRCRSARTVAVAETCRRRRH